LGLVAAVLKSFLGPDAEPVVPGEGELRQVVRSRYPVHAAGYNWTQSNLQSAEDVLAGIRNILQGYRGQGETCRQVILVTHSMGGLVARVVSQLAAEAGEPDLVLGVVHGVMPAIGAPVAYRRMVAGTEAERLVWLKELRGAFPTIAGRTAAETTPVMANAPGALELLPSHLYPPGWLKVERPAGAEGVQTVFTLPERDPYQEIYRQRNTWWRMVDPGLLDPAQIGGWTAEGYHPELAWENFLKRMSEVEALHRTRLARHHYHSPSFYFYGEQEPTFGSVRWLLGPSAVDLREGEIRVSRPGPGDGKGSCELRAFPRGAPSGGRVGGEYDPGQEFRFHAELAPADDLGDGTVPTISGHAPASVIPYGVATDVQRFDHADAFKNLLSQMFTAMAICKLAGAGAPGGQP
jgi:pimeloyl-ACP methyl ester carboxylesterase